MEGNAKAAAVEREIFNFAYLPAFYFCEHPREVVFVKLSDEFIRTLVDLSRQSIRRKERAEIFLRIIQGVMLLRRYR
jgi:hypothetical protein